MCDFPSNQEITNAILVARIVELEKKLEECQLRSIEARNPGIDMELVRQQRREVKGREE